MTAHFSQKNIGNFKLNRIATHVFSSLNNIDCAMNKKGNVLTSYACAGCAPGCDNNVISSRGTSRGKIEGAAESSPSSFLPR